MPKNSKALVTLLIGDFWPNFWRQWFEKSWRAYADKHGYDIVILEDWIEPDPKGRKAHWQKCLLAAHPEVAGYEDAVWVDADILINFHQAPCIVTEAAKGDPDKIGVVTHSRLFDTPERLENRWNRMHRRAGDPRFKAERGPTPRERYEQAGLGSDVDDITNTGVMVFKPALHAELYRHVFETYEETPLTSNEEKPLSYEIFKRGMANPLDPRFNQWWVQDICEHFPFLLNPTNHAKNALVCYCVNAAWHNSWFHHYIADGYSRGDVQWVQVDAPDAVGMVIAS